MHLLIAGNLARWWPAQQRLSKLGRPNRYLGNAVIWCEHHLRGFAVHPRLGSESEYEPWAISHVRSGRLLFRASDPQSAARAVDFLGSKLDGYMHENQLALRFVSLSGGRATCLESFGVWLESSTRDWRPVEHDYTRRGWGHDFSVVNLDLNGRVLRLTGWGAGIEDGHFLILPNGGETTRYLVTSIKYESDPRDMWVATALFAPRGIVPVGSVH